MVAATPDGGTVEADWIIQKLARPVPMQTRFVEVRESALLKAPLRIAGEYRRPAADTLVREVHSPYQETTTIRAGQATVVRAGKARTFSLQRVPELAGMQASFGALLAGDRTALDTLYQVQASGQRDRWVLTLLPRDRQLAKRIQQVALFGRGSELRCIQTQLASSGKPERQVQRTLLAGAARQAAEAPDDAALDALCQGDR